MADIDDLDHSIEELKKSKDVFTGAVGIARMEKTAMEEAKKQADNFLHAMNSCDTYIDALNACGVDSTSAGQTRMELERAYDQHRQQQQMAKVRYNQAVKNVQAAGKEHIDAIMALSKSLTSPLQY